MKMIDPAMLHQTLAMYNVSYVFMGSQEQGHPFAGALRNTTNFALVYGDEGNTGTKVYEVLEKRVGRHGGLARASSSAGQV